jgi:hypothetical protein
VREHRLRERDGAEEHRLHHVAQVVGLDRLDGADRSDAGVVDQHVDAAEAVERRRDGALDLVGLGDPRGRAVHIAQQSLSQQIRTLEAQLGVTPITITRTPLVRPSDLTAART